MMLLSKAQVKTTEENATETEKNAEDPKVSTVNTDNMETDETLPERQIVSVTVKKDKNGRLGLKVTGVPSGIYVEDFDVNFVKMDGNMFKKGDRIVAINGRSLENVKYENAVDMMRRSDDTVQFLVSQIT